MSYKEVVHKHQSDKLIFVPTDYIPVQISAEGNKIYGTVSLKEGVWSVDYSKRPPAFGGYISKGENIYGNAFYCPNATKHHKKHLEKYKSMPHLVFFDSEESAVKAGFRKCKVCLK